MADSNRCCVQQQPSHERTLARVDMSGDNHANLGLATVAIVRRGSKPSGWDKSLSETRMLSTSMSDGAMC